MEGAAKWLATGFETRGGVTARGSIPPPSANIVEDSNGEYVGLFTPEQRVGSIPALGSAREVFSAARRIAYAKGRVQIPFRALK